MKKLVQVTEVEGEGLIGLMGQNVLLQCANYFYTGKLIGVNDDYVEIEKPSIVFDIDWDKGKYTVLSKITHVPSIYVRIPAIESFMVSL